MFLIQLSGVLSLKKEKERAKGLHGPGSEGPSRLILYQARGC